MINANLTDEEFLRWAIDYSSDPIVRRLIQIYDEYEDNRIDSMDNLRFQIEDRDRDIERLGEELEETKHRLRFLNLEKVEKELEKAAKDIEEAVKRAQHWETRAEEYKAEIKRINEKMEHWNVLNKKFD